MVKNTYNSGEWNVICDCCGHKFKASEIKERWDGLRVCPADFEIRQSLDFVKSKTDKISVPWTRPRPVDIFVGNVSAVAGIAIAGIAIAGKYVYVSEPPPSGTFNNGGL